MAPREKERLVMNVVFENHLARGAYTLGNPLPMRLSRKVSCIVCVY